MAVNGTGSMVILVIVLLAVLTFEAQVDGKPQDNFHRVKDDNVSRIIDHTGVKEVKEPALSEGGNNPKQFPWQMYLTITKSDGLFECGGSIIDQQWMMSAAHCFAEKKSTDNGKPDGYKLHVKALYMFAGITDTDLKYKDVNRKMFLYLKPEDIKTRGSDQNLFVHKDYNKEVVFNNDIALFKLKYTLKFTNFIKPILLATAEDHIPEKLLLTASGWGKMSFEKNAKTTTKLRYVTGLMLKSQGYCKEKYDGFNKDTMICHETPDKRTFTGDSGGPVIFETEGIEPAIAIQIGIVSWGKPEAGYYGNVFTNVAHFRPWIHATMGYSPSNACPENSDYFRPTGSKQCFKLLKDLVTWKQAEEGCTEQGLKLAHPHDAVGLRRYIIERYGSLDFLWLEASRENNDGQMQWGRSGDEITIDNIPPRISEDNPLWYNVKPHYNPSTRRPGCLLLLSTEAYWKKSPKEPYWDCPCDYLSGAVCEMVLS